MDYTLFAKLIKIGGIILISIFSVLVITGFITGETDVMSEIYEKIGTVAEIAAIAAFALWISRLVLMQLKKRKLPFVKWFQLLFKVLKEHHTLIGWAAFTAALAHGSYFFLQTSEEIESIYSGLATFSALAVLVATGFILNKSGKGKTYLKFKKIHQGIAIVFGIALGVHLLFG